MKKLRLTIGIVLLCILLTGCGNKDIGFGNYEYHYVTCNGVISLNNELITSWKDFEDGEQIEVTLAKDGNNLLLSSNRCILSKNQID